MFFYYSDWICAISGCEGFSVLQFQYWWLLVVTLYPFSFTIFFFFNGLSLCSSDCLELTCSPGLNLLPQPPRVPGSLSLSTPSLLKFLGLLGSWRWTEGPRAVGRKPLGTAVLSVRDAGPGVLHGLQGALGRASPASSALQLHTQCPRTSTRFAWTETGLQWPLKE